MQNLDWASFLNGMLGGAAGALLIVAGLSRWLGDVWLGRILQREKAKYSSELEQLKSRYAKELEAFRATLDRSVFVSRVQFETEFNSMKQVYQALAEVRLTMASVRPTFSVGLMDEPDTEKRRRLGERLGELTKAYNKLVAEVENLAPFYPRELYAQLEECLRAAQREVVDVQTGGDDTFSPSWYQDGSRNRDRFMAAHSAVTELIRERISRFSVPIRN